MIEARDYQLDLLERIREAFTRVDRVLFVGPVGSGKCLGLGTMVLRFDGQQVSVEDVRRGDLLMGPDSQPRRVLSTTRGHGALYRIVPVKGQPWICNDVHVLTLVHTVDSRIVDIDLQSYIAQSRNFKNNFKQWAPPQGIDFAPARPLPLDPYFMGVWFGDGTKKLVPSQTGISGVAISKPDPEILDLCNQIASLHGLYVRTDGEQCPTHHIHGVKGKKNCLLDLIRDLVGQTVTVPISYLRSSREDRMQFLAGWLDSDGYNSGGCFEIAQKRRDYADAIMFLARSLGFRANVVPKVVEGETYWRISLSGDFGPIPLRIERKKCAARRQKKCATRTGIRVESVGHGPYAGFELDGDGRFLLGDFTVTHNTVVFSHHIHRVKDDGGVLLTAHRRELIKQPFRKLIRNGENPSDVGVILAGTSHKNIDGAALPPEKLTDDELWKFYARRRPQAKIQVGSIDTLRCNAKPKVKHLCVDEAHRSMAKSYCDLILELDQENMARYGRRTKVLGASASPLRQDGKSLGEEDGGIYEEMVVGPQYMELVKLGYLVEPTVYTVPEHLRANLKGIKRTKSDYNATELNERVNKVELVGNIIEHWKKYGRNQPTLVFAVSVDHSKHIAKQFNDAGIPAMHVDGTMGTDDRDKAERAILSGEVKVIVNCDVFTEGTDFPCVKTIICARPTLSLRIALQQAGRGSRPWQDEPFVILDHAGLFLPRKEGGKFGLPQDDRQWSLSAGLIEGWGGGGGSVRPPPRKTCPQCGAREYISALTCGGCILAGHEKPYAFPESTTDPTNYVESNDELVKVHESELHKQKTLRPHEVKLLERWNGMIAAWRIENSMLDMEDKPLIRGGVMFANWQKETGKPWQPKGSKGGIPSLTEEEEARTKARERRDRMLRRGQKDLFADGLRKPTSEHLEDWTDLI